MQKKTPGGASEERSKLRGAAEERRNIMDYDVAEINRIERATLATAKRRA
jgi:hypothetical protein